MSTSPGGTHKGDASVHTDVQSHAGSVPQYRVRPPGGLRSATTLSTMRADPVGEIAHQAPKFGPTSAKGADVRDAMSIRESRVPCSERTNAHRPSGVIASEPGV